tara:strand:- start:2302 stop:3936 length:1635 start_codon:yes stop_codon:yes gene_type:complete
MGGAIRALFVGDMTNSLGTKEGSGTLLFYTQPGANLDNMYLQGLNWEVNGQPSSAANIRIENAGEGVVNFFLPRLDLTYFNIINTPITARLGTSGVVRLYLWNRVNAPNTALNFQNGPDNFYYDGVTASYVFIDRDLGTPVTSNVKVITKSDISGSMTTLANYTLDANGHLQGTYDSQFEVSGTSITRDTYYLFQNYSDVSQSTYSAGGGDSYGIVSVNNQIEIRGYLYEPPVGFLAGNNVPFSDPQGALNPDGSVQTYQQFTLNNDLNITESDINIVTAYADVSTIEEAYDAQKAFWYLTDDVGLLGRLGQQLDLGSNNLILDSSLGTLGSSTSNTVSLKANSYSGGATATTGKITTLNGTLLSGGTFDCNIDYYSGASTTLTNVICNNVLDFNAAGTYDINGGTINEVTNSSGGNITLNMLNGATITTNTGPNITLNNNVTVNLDVTDTSGTAIQNARVRIVATETVGTITTGDVILEGLTDASGNINTTTLNYEGAFNPSGLSIQIKARQGSVSPFKKPFVGTGVITSSGFNSTIALLGDE